VTFDMRSFGGFQKVGKWTLVRKGPDGSKIMTNILKANSTQSQWIRPSVSSIIQRFNIMEDGHS